jgi:monoterpene epsilon-lactone hydrolase
MPRATRLAAIVRDRWTTQADPNDPLASPLFGNLRGLPPVRVHVDDEEILLEDSRRYVARAVEAGVDAKLDVWLGMPHGSVGSLSAAD